MLLNTNYPVVAPTKWSFGLTPLPSSSTPILTRNTKLVYGYFANSSASAVSVTVTDGSTENSGSACPVVPAISIPANSIEVVTFNGVLCNGGVSWFASSAGVVFGQLIGEY